MKKIFILLILFCSCNAQQKIVHRENIQHNTEKPAPTDTGILFYYGAENGLLGGFKRTSSPITAANAGDWQIDNQIYRAGKASLKITSRPGVMSKNNISNKTELIGCTDRPDENSGTKFYTLSVYLHSPWAEFEDPKGGIPHGTICQLHAPVLEESKGLRPMFGLNATNGRFWIVHHFGSTENIVRTKNKVIEFNRDSALALDHWVDFIFKIKYGKTDGSITIWRRDEGESNFTQALDIQNTCTLFYSDAAKVTPMDWHIGLYFPAQSRATHIINYDCFSVDNSFSAAVSAFK